MAPHPKPPRAETRRGDARDSRSTASLGHAASPAPRRSTDHRDSRYKAQAAAGLSITTLDHRNLRDLDPLAVWREWAADVQGTAIDCGHFLCEEAPDATAKALIEFFTR